MMDHDALKRIREFCPEYGTLDPPLKNTFFEYPEQIPLVPQIEENSFQADSELLVGQKPQKPKNLNSGQTVDDEAGIIPEDF